VNNLFDRYLESRFGHDIFNDINREFAEAEDMLNRMFRTVREIGPTKAVTAEYPYYYGYQLTIGPDGKPKTQEFGNVRPAAKGLCGTIR
jgi:HSP20 family protein